jgi:hypothetical protein
VFDNVGGYNDNVCMSEISGLIERMRALQRDLVAVAGVRLAGATDEVLCAFTVAVEDAGRLLDALRIASAGEVGDRSSPGLGHDGLAFRLGHGKAVLLLAALTRASNAEAARRLKLGAATRVRPTIDGTVLEPFHPLVTGALDAGEIGVEAAARIVRALDEAGRVASDEEIRCAESELVNAARSDTADEIGVQAIVWREFLDQDGAEPREARAYRKRSFRFGAERDGLVPFSGQMELLNAALLKEAFEEAFRATKPRFLAAADGGEYDPSDPGGGAARVGDATTAEAVAEPVPLIELVEITAPDTPSAEPDSDPGADPHAESGPRGAAPLAIHPPGDRLTALEAEIAKDPRSTEQRQHDVLTGLITAGIRSTGNEPGGLRSTATITAVIGLDDLKQGTGVGWVEGIKEPVSATALQKLVEASGYATLVEGDNGEILYLTRHKRLFTAQQIKALLVRDGGCAWPGCGAKAGGCDAHHIIPWSEGGLTDVDNGILLCPYHHGMLHDSAFTLKMIRGKPHLLAPPWIDPDQRWIPIGKSRIARLNGLHKAG